MNPLGSALRTVIPCDTGAQVFNAHIDIRLGNASDVASAPVVILGEAFPIAPFRFGAVSVLRCEFKNHGDTFKSHRHSYLLWTVHKMDGSD